MVIAAGVLSTEMPRCRILFEMLDRFLQIFEQQACEIASHAKARHHALHDQVSTIRGHRIGGHLPSFDSQAISKIAL